MREIQTVTIESEKQRIWKLMTQGAWKDVGPTELHLRLQEDIIKLKRQRQKLAHAQSFQAMNGRVELPVTTLQLTNNAARIKAKQAVIAWLEEQHGLEDPELHEDHEMPDPPQTVDAFKAAVEQRRTLIANQIAS